MGTAKVAVVLSGCGVFDGSEIHESVITLLCLARAGVSYQCMAPNIVQTTVINHLTGKESPEETRNVLVEAARIARGEIIDLAQADPTDYCAAIFPGGFGTVSNLSDFAIQGSACQVQPSVLNFSRAMAKAKKPMGFICIAPHLIPKIYGSGVQLTIGTDQATANQINQMGGAHIDCAVNHIVIDDIHAVVSTPAYMLANNPAEVASGVEKLVDEVLRLCTTTEMVR